MDSYLFIYLCMVAIEQVWSDSVKWGEEETKEGRESLALGSWSYEVLKAWKAEVVEFCKPERQEARERLALKTI